MKLCQPDDLGHNIVPIFSHTVESCNILTIQAGTNCPQGGDFGHGGRTVLRLINEACTDLRVRVNGGAVKEVEKIEIILGGDCEAHGLVKGLEFAVKVLNSQLRRDLAGRDERIA